MSSEGSVTSSSSRLRQFGLYRTIDAKTDEFLRSSRKRQITQGCACAAISTAITVTVVVSVILVYEYSINIDANENKKISTKTNWLGFTNDSDTSIIDQKYMKNVNLDKSSLKLLPILLKALNENRYLEKIIEGYSSSSPPNEKIDNIENYVKRNIFSDAKNWLKMPSPKIYTLDYKTTPLIYIKRPSQHLEYLTRIRKMKNYERMLNYFDKMINDKVAFARPISIGHYEYTENPLKSTTKKKKVSGKKKLKHKSKLHESIKKHKETKMRPPKVSIKNHLNDSNVNCRCPKDMGNLMNKLIQSLQQVVPRSDTPEAPCSKKQNNQHSFMKKLMPRIPTNSIDPRLIIHSTSTGSNKSREVILNPKKQIFLTLPLSTDTKTELIKYKHEPEETTKVMNMEIITGNFFMDSIFNDIKTEISTPETETKTSVNKQIKSMNFVPQIVYENTTNEIRTEPTVTEMITEPTKLAIKNELVMKEIRPEAPMVENKAEFTTDELKTEAYSTQYTTDETEAETVIIRDKIYSTTEAINYKPKDLLDEQLKKKATEIPLMFMSTYMKNRNEQTPYYDKIHHLAKFISKTEKFSTTEVVTTEDKFKYFDYTTLSTPFTSEPILEPMPMYEIYDTNSTTFAPVPQTTPINIATTEKKTTTTEVIVPVKFNDGDDGFLSNENNFVDTAVMLPRYKHPVVPVYREEDYDYVMPIPKTKEADSEASSFSLIKPKGVEKTDSISNFKNNMRKIGYRSKLSNYHPVIKNRDMDMNNMRKMADLVYRKKKLIEENTTPTYNETKGIKVNNMDDISTTDHSIKAKQKKKLTGLLKRIIKPKIEPSASLNAGDKHDQALLSQIKLFQAGNIETEEEFQEEWAKQSEIIERTNHYNKSEKFIYDEIPLSAQYDADKMKSVDKLISVPYKSMLPPLRPGYLEVRRNNDWKPDDQSDYDNMNLANNFFDLPNN